MTAATHAASDRTTHGARRPNSVGAAPGQGESAVLSSRLFAGPFSLIAREPALIDCAPGFEVRVRKGSLRLTETRTRRQHVVRNGEAFVVTEDGPLMLARMTRVELALVHPR